MGTSEREGHTPGCFSDSIGTAVREPVTQQNKSQMYYGITSLTYNSWLSSQPLLSLHFIVFEIPSSLLQGNI